MKDNARKRARRLAKREQRARHFLIYLQHQRESHLPPLAVITSPEVGKLYREFEAHRAIAKAAIRSLREVRTDEQ